MDQNLRSIIIPEIGLNLDPPTIREIHVATDFIRAISHLAAKGTTTAVMLRCTTAGALHVAGTGTANEIYACEEGTAADSYTAPNTYAFTNAVNVIDILIETFGALVSFQDSGSLWGDDKRIPVGFFSFDLVANGIKIRNRTPGSNAVYQVTTFR